MILKKHKDEKGRTILAICDSDLMGRTISEGKKQLDLSSPFYRGKETEDLDKFFKDAYIINAVGDTTIKKLINAGIIKDEEVKRIQGTPHVQVVFEERS